MPNQTRLLQSRSYADLQIRRQAFANQRKFLHLRNACGSDAQCLQRLYESRYHALVGCAIHSDLPYFAPSTPTASTNPDRQESLVRQCSRADRVNYPFIKKEEGLMLDAYVPGSYRTDQDDTHRNLGPRYLKNGERGNVVRASGITIGFGVDLGQQTEQNLHQYMQTEEKNYGKPATVDNDEILRKLSGLYGYKKEKAVAVLDAYKAKNKKYPKLEMEEAVFLSRAVMHGYYHNATTYYNRQSKMDLRTLPAAVQTVVTDAAYNGWGPVKQEVREMLFNGKWQAAADALLHDDNKNPTYRKRNRLRGSQLQEAMVSGNLPKSGDPCQHTGGKGSIARIEYRQRYGIMTNGSYSV